MTELEIDQFKTRTLKRLQTSEKDIPSHPIGEEDLLHLDQCPVCGSKDLTLISEVQYQGKFTFFATSACSHCFFTFRSVSPGLGWFKKCWARIATDKPDVFNPEVETIRAKRYQTYADAISRNLDSKGELLDIGAAYGTGAKIFQDAGFKVEVVEPEENKRNFIERSLGIPVACHTIEELADLDKKYDAVCIANCLEHLDDPIAALQTIRGVLKPEGVLYLDVPTLWEFVTWSDAFYLTHKCYFIEKNLTHLLGRIGFDTLETFDIHHGANDPSDIGVILKVGPVRKGGSIDLTEKYSINDVRDMYLKHLPFPYEEQVIKYNVDSIEHFYQTVRLDSKKPQPPTDSSGLITFVAR